MRCMLIRHVALLRAHAHWAVCQQANDLHVLKLVVNPILLQDSSSTRTSDLTTSPLRGVPGKVETAIAALYSGTTAQVDLKQAVLIRSVHRWIRQADVLLQLHLYSIAVDYLRPPCST